MKGADLAVDIGERANGRTPIRRMESLMRLDPVVVICFRPRISPSPAPALIDR